MANLKMRGIDGRKGLTPMPVVQESSSLPLFICEMGPLDDVLLQVGMVHCTCGMPPEQMIVSILTPVHPPFYQDLGKATVNKPLNFVNSMKPVRTGNML